MEDLPSESIEKLARVTKLLKTQRTLPAQLEAAVSIAKRSLPNCHAAGISLVLDGEPITSAVSDRLAVEVDLVQYRTGEGPCLEAMRTTNVIRVDVVERDRRFTRFAPGALDLEINSVLSIPLTMDGRTVGGLNLYSRDADAFDAGTEAAVRPIADFAAEAIATSPLFAYTLDMVDGLVETLESRALIAQAMGVIMATEQRTSEEALNRLRELAMTSSEAMRTVAQWVLDERPTGPQPAEADPAALPDDR
jgi:GAF domain-containing protein